MFFRVKKSQSREYLQIVENRREDGKVKQRVIATLGRIEQLQESGQLDGLLQSGARFAEAVLLVSAHAKGELPTICSRRIGAVKVFERLWCESGCQGVINELLAHRQFELPVERAIFLSVLHRLLSPGSDRALFARHRDLFSELELVFFDTTSIYFEGEGGETVGQRGYSKDQCPDIKQLVVGAVLDGHGRPVACELWPGNTTDVQALVPVAERLSRRFGIQRVCLVADRGMISAETIAELEQHEWPYILGARMRRQKEVSQRVLARAGRYRVVREPAQGKGRPAPLKLKQVMLEDRRYIVCLNENQAKKDAADREAIVTALREQLKKGDKSLVGNRGYRKYLKSKGAHFEIDEAKLKAEARYDGKWVLRTNTALSAEEVALKYKQLWQVEALFRTTKSLLETRPIFHQRDETIRGHVFCSFLALILRKALLDRLEAAGHVYEWADVLRDLEALQEVEVEHHDKRFRLRTEARGSCGSVFLAVGVALPPTVQQIREVPAAV
jgi:transposase